MDRRRFLQLGSAAIAVVSAKPFPAETRAAQRQPTTPGGREYRTAGHYGQLWQGERGFYLTAHKREVSD